MSGCADGDDLSAVNSNFNFEILKTTHRLAARRPG